MSHVGSSRGYGGVGSGRMEGHWQNQDCDNGSTARDALDSSCPTDLEEFQARSSDVAAQRLSAVDALLAPVVQVSYHDHFWWDLPSPLSEQIVEKKQEGCVEASYVWDWGDKKKGTWKLEGAATSFSRYMINFNSMTQRNLDSSDCDHVRLVRIMWRY